MDLCRNVVDSLNESLIPFAHVTREVLGNRRNSAGLAVQELTRESRPVPYGTSCTSDEVLNNLTIDLKSNLLRENLGQLHLSVKVVVGVKILS